MNAVPTPPIVLTDKAKDLNDKFYLILNEVVKTYPTAKLHGDNPSKFDRKQTNNAVYDANMEQLVNLQNDYFLYKNDVVRSTEAIEQIIQSTDKQINGLEVQNKILSTQLAGLKSSSYSAEGLFDDAQITRNQLLISNFIIFGVMCGGGFLYYKTFKV
jgi:hypothetical protein